jgi:hypothetical protein
MTTAPSKILAVAVAFAAWVMPFVATPFHLYCAHSCHDDCPACRAAKLRNPQFTCPCCCGFCASESSLPRTLFSKKPPEHNHELCDSAGRCIICQMLSMQYRTLVPEEQAPFDWKLIAFSTPKNRVRIPSEFRSCIFGRAPPLPAA